MRFFGEKERLSFMDQLSHFSVLTPPFTHKIIKSKWQPPFTIQQSVFNHMFSFGVNPPPWGRRHNLKNVSRAQANEIHFPTGRKLFGAAGGAKELLKGG